MNVVTNAIIKKIPTNETENSVEIMLSNLTLDKCPATNKL